MPEVIETINAAMKKELGNTNITFSFNPRTHKVNVALAAKHCIGLYGQLTKILGFGGGDIKARKSKESPYGAESQAMLSRKRLTTFSTCPCRQSLARTLKSF